MKGAVCCICGSVLVNENDAEDKIYGLNFYKKIVNLFRWNGSFSRRKTYNDLISLDDHLLRDIGLHRETLLDSLRQRE